MQANVVIRVTVDFDDDGRMSMAQQAERAALFELGLPVDLHGKVGDAVIDSISCTKRSVRKIDA